MTTTRRTLILAVLLVAAGSLIFTTGAAVIDGEADTLADDRVAIQPAAGPNGDYAYLNDDDEIVVDVSPTNPNVSADFEGVNAGSTGRIGDVFTITYTANETADVWIEHEGENVTFVTDDGSIEGEANASELDPDGSVSIGLQFDMRGAEPNTRLGAEEFAIHANVTDPDSDLGSSSNAGQQSESGDDEDPETTPVAEGETDLDNSGSTSDSDDGESTSDLDDGGSTSDSDNDGSTSDSGDNSSLAPPTEEPGGFGPANLGQVAALLAAVVAVLALARRRRRS